jgi:hypothetical protein
VGSWRSTIRRAGYIWDSQGINSFYHSHWGIKIVLQLYLRVVVEIMLEGGCVVVGISTVWGRLSVCSPDGSSTNTNGIFMYVWQYPSGTLSLFNGLLDGRSTYFCRISCVPVSISAEHFRFLVSLPDGRSTSPARVP